MRRATAAEVIAHTRVMSRPGAHIGRPVDLNAQSDLIGVPEPMSVESVLADQADIARPASAVPSSRM
jgi:cell pole-organizing protein PopZ